MSTDGKNVYEREKLYEQVWNAPVIQVAKLYGVSNVAIKKMCKSMNIPTPPNGYWTKLRNGKKVQKIPLAPAKEGQNIRYGIDPNTKKVKNDLLSFLNPVEQKSLYEVIQSLKLAEKDEFCEEIREYQKVVNEWNKKNPSIEGLRCSYTDYKYRYSAYISGEYCRPPILVGVISKSGLERAYRILDALIKGMKQLEYTVNDDMSFQIRGEKIEFYIYEKQSYFTHVITPDDIKKLEKYEKNIRRDRWAQKPFIPTEDYLFNGKLLFNTKKYSYVQDKDGTFIEEHLLDMFMQLIQQSEIIKRERLAKEELERKRKEEKRLRDLPTTTYNDEVDNLKGLLNYANDFEIACRIRKFVNHLEESRNNIENAEFIAWANDKADWYDPTISKTDEILGIRGHGSDPIPEKKEEPYY